MKLGIVHYRAGRTDGVSLEMTKRREVLQEMGHEVRIISGPVSLGSDYVIDQLEFDSPEVRDIKESAFEYFGSGPLSQAELMDTIRTCSRQIEDVFSRIDESEQFDALMLHNVFSHGRHIAAASAFTQFLIRRPIPALATHHDYYWERPEYQHPSSEDVSDFLARFVPPQLPNLRHVSINSLAAAGLSERSGIHSEVYGDFFDFDQPEWGIDAFNHDLPERCGFRASDLIVLQATRIVRRKGIEMAMDLVGELTNNLDALQGQTLYNGKRLADDARISFVLAGYAEQSASDYLSDLKRHAEDLGIDVHFIGGQIEGARTRTADGKMYSLWDVYPHADIVTYPSLQEGWGNQFIEAVFARKPVVLFEYPVYASDIKQEGYTVLSLGAEVHRADEHGLVHLTPARMAEAGEASIEALVDPKIVGWLDTNFEIGRSNHGFQALRGFLDVWLNSLVVKGTRLDNESAS